MHSTAHNHVAIGDVLQPFKKYSRNWKTSGRRKTRRRPDTYRRGFPSALLTSLAIGGWVALWRPLEIYLHGVS